MSKSKEEKSRDNKREKFINELTELSKKYGLKIGGCGCCGSPWVIEMTKSEIQRGGYVDQGRLDYK